MLKEVVVTKRLLRAARLRLPMLPKGEIVATGLKKANAQEETSAHGKTHTLMIKQGPEAGARAEVEIQEKKK